MAFKIKLPLDWAEIFPNPSTIFIKNCSPKTNIKGNNNGNGSLMRLAPIPIAFHSNKEKALQYASE